MIRSFRDRDTLAFYEGKRVRRFDGFRDQATRRLQMLDDATALRDLAGVPGNRVEALSGNRRDQFSIRINAQWRVCFRWGSDGPYDVEIVDYH
ncbi:MAG TPA: type II toxin-antitoxin system RelE/ParE family toxin [Stellaceae bacterium]